MLERSDLYPRDGKNQHAFCADIDRRHDVRVLANCEPGTRWLATMVHELGHAVYDLAIDSQLPWLLRQPAHTFTTEAIAMLHGRLVRDEAFLERFARVDPAIARDPRNVEMQRRELLVFAPWVQVMTRFERELYRDPDQDLGAVWWQLVERYQRVAPPRRAASRRLGLQDPRRPGAGLLPQLPARRGDRVAALVRPGARDRRGSPAVERPLRPASSCASASCARARRCAGMR